MMSILVKGMEMPKNCGECLLAKLSPTGESLVCNLDLSTVSWEERPFTCLLTEVPPHGRLIDADELEPDTEWMYGDDGYTAYSLRQIADAPTIIEAEEGET